MVHGRSWHRLSCGGSSEYSYFKPKYRKDVKKLMVSLENRRQLKLFTDFPIPKPLPDKYLYIDYHSWKEREQQKRMFKMLMAPTAIQVHAPHYFLGPLNSDL